MITSSTLYVDLLPGGQLPKRNLNSAGYDLYASESVLVYRKSASFVPLGIRTEIPPGWYGQIFDRSGMAAKGMHVMGGVIDSDYRGEWKAILYNTTEENFQISAGDRIAQVVFLQYGVFQLVQSSNLDNTTRGNSGFGSSGV